MKTIDTVCLPIDLVKQVIELWQDQIVDSNYDYGGAFKLWDKHPSLEHFLKTFREALEQPRVEPSSYWRKRLQEVEQQCVRLKEKFANDQAGAILPVEPIGYFHMRDGKVTCTQLTKKLMQCMNGEDGRVPLYAVPPQQTEEHTDDSAVDRFADVMKTKLATSREKGRGGWNDPEQCTVEHLAKLLVEHLVKGDPVDVANFAMMLHQRGADNTVLASAASVKDNRPLTYEQIVEIDEQALNQIGTSRPRKGYCELFARGVERAHGIVE